MRLWFCPIATPTATWLLVVTHVLVMANTLLATDPVPPEIAGFDRFARHGEISPELGGRLLISELSCTACHASGDESLRAKTGPDLSDAGLRLRYEWVTRFIADPSAVKPGTTMPDLLDGLAEDEKADAIASLSAYLSTLRKPLPEIKASGLTPVPHRFWELGDATNGRSIFHRVGCVACHAADPEYHAAVKPASPVDSFLELLDEDELAELGLASAARPAKAVSLGDPASKYSAHSLALFLLSPETTRPAGRMPNLKLAPTEAADVAAYLMSRDTTEPSETTEPSDVSRRPAQGRSPEETPEPDADAGAIQRGRQWFVKQRCASCHTTGDPLVVELAKTVTPATAWDLVASRTAAATGCLAPRSDGVPQYRLDDSQRDAIAAIGGESRPGPDDSLELSMLRFNCHACHRRGEIGGVSHDRRGYFETVGNEDLGDEGRLPPTLSGVHRKLQPAWLARVLQGTATIRPHMHVRMPKYSPGDVKTLVDRFVAVAVADQDSPSTSPHDWPDAADERAGDAGRLMMDTGCVQCHPFRGESMPGVTGVDLHGIADRVNPIWFRNLLSDPGAVNPRTRMPNFFPDGKSQHPDLLGGDPDRQIAAMWGYLKRLGDEPLPAKIEEARAQDFELRPADRPIVLRTFMRDAGTHAIAVGFPRSIHLAFDSQNPRLAALWRGRFLDAQGTWFVRAAPPADPLGDSLVTFDNASPFVFSKGNLPPTNGPEMTGIATPFRGYRIDRDGIPTFEYRLGRLAIEDRFEPTNESPPGIVRILRITRHEDPPDDERGHTNIDDGEILFRLLVGETLTPEALGTQPDAIETAAASDDLPGQPDTILAMRNESGLRVAVSPDVAAMSSVRTEAGVASWVVPIAARPSIDGEIRDGESSSPTLLELRYQW